MITPNELINGIITVQTLLDRLEVRGVVNAKTLAIAYEQCSLLKDQLKQTFEEIQNGSKTEQEAGEVNAEIDTDVT